MTNSLESDFIILELPLEDSPLQMQTAIENALQERGDPLRWAVTAVDIETQLMRIEAIVTRTRTTPLAQEQPVF